MSSKDLFSGHADLYAKYRPLYPPELFEFLVQYVPAKNKALDCGTGNGQAAAALAEYFTEVNATDISEKQVKNAIQKPNLYYYICPAEKTPFADNNFDLITCATALHWFRFEEYYAEMKRIATNNAIFAGWAYEVLKTSEPAVNELINHFYTKTIDSYWDPERKHIDENYSNIPFPFEEIPNPGFATRLEWNTGILEGYLNTWSAVQHYIRKNNTNPVTTLIKEIRTVFDDQTPLKITFPIFMRLGIIKK
jgi:SAM-dependent methyltransferase